MGHRSFVFYVNKRGADFEFMVIQDIKDNAYDKDMGHFGEIGPLN